MAGLNDYIDNYADSSSFSVEYDLNTQFEESMGGITFVLQNQYVPSVILNLTVRLMNETANKALLTYLIDNRTKTMKLDLTRYRVDYNGSDLLIKNQLSGTVNVILDDKVISNRIENNAGNLHTSTIKLKIVRNEIV